MDFVGKRYWYFLLSALVVVPGLVAILVWGLPLSIDFTGGSLLELQFPAGRDIAPAEVKAVFAQHGLDDAMVQTSGRDVVLIRTRQIDLETKVAVGDDIRARWGDFTELRFEAVGPAIGEQVTQRGILAIAAAAVAILLYISFAFRRVPSPFRYGTCAIIAMLHDVVVVVGFAAFAGRLFGWQVDALFLTALLTVIGFSVHDTIVVFDRIRENMSRRRGEPVEAIVNHSIMQTLDRSINTQLTVVFTLTAFTLFGGITIRHFVVVLLVGIISGTYSSIFNASQLLVVWEKGEVAAFWNRLRQRLVGGFSP